MGAGTEGDGKAARSTARDGRFDFERLEQSVEFLIDEHARLSAEREALLAELADREHRLRSLEAQLGSERQRRATAIEGVDKLLARLEQLQSSVSAYAAGHEVSPASAEAAGSSGPAT